MSKVVDGVREAADGECERWQVQEKGGQGKYSYNEGGEIWVPSVTEGSEKMACVRDRRVEMTSMREGKER